MDRRLFITAMRRAAPLLIVLLLALALCGDAGRWSGYAVIWGTGNEIDVAGYIVERADSADGPWTRASGLIVAQEDAFAEHDYRFMDMTGEHWHRLTVINLKNEAETLGVIAP